MFSTLVYYYIVSNLITDSRYYFNIDIRTREALKLTKAEFGEEWQFIEVPVIVVKAAQVSTIFKMVGVSVSVEIMYC